MSSDLIDMHPHLRRPGVSLCQSTSRLVRGLCELHFWNDLIVGVLVILLAVRRGPVRERYGNYERWIR